MTFIQSAIWLGLVWLSTGLATNVTTPLASIFPNSTFLNSSDSSGDGLLVGRAKIDITPPPNPNWMPLGEFAMEKLHVRAIVFENDGVRGALINAEVANILQAVYQSAAAKVSAAIDAPIDNIILTPVHAHGAFPDGTGLFAEPHWGNGGLVKYDSLGDAAVAACTKAMENMIPASVGYGTGEAYNNVNRDHLNPLTGRWTQGTNLTGPVDREVEVLTFIARNGTPIAAYTSYAMHPVQTYLAGYCNADWPGAMAWWVEESLGSQSEFVLIYNQQASGDVNPRLRRTGTNNIASIGKIDITGLELVQEPVEEPIRDGYIPLIKSDPYYLRQMFTQLTALGITIGEEVIRIISMTDEWDESPMIWGKQQNCSCPGRTQISKEREGLPGTYTTGPTVEISTGALGLGEIVIAHVAAEIYTRIGWRIKAETPMNKTMLVTMANGAADSGYIPDALSFTHETFQVLGCKMMPGDCPEANISGSIAQLISEYQAALNS